MTVTNLKAPSRLPFAAMTMMTDGTEKKQVWLAKPSTPKRAKVSAALHEVSRSMEKATSEPARTQKKKEDLVLANNALRTANAKLREDNNGLRKKLGTPLNTGATQPYLRNDRTATIDALRKENETLAEANEDLQGRNFVLRQALVTDAQLDTLFATLTTVGITPDEVKDEADKFFSLLDGLNAERGSVPSTVRVYRARMEEHLSALTPDELQSLETAASAYLRNDKFQTPVPDKAVVQSILFGAQAVRLGITTNKVDLQNARDATLKSIIQGANALWLSAETHISELKSSQGIPGTTFSKDSLRAFFLDAVAVSQQREADRAQKTSPVKARQPTPTRKAAKLAFTAALRAAIQRMSTAKTTTSSQKVGDAHSAAASALVEPIAKLGHAADLYELSPESQKKWIKDAVRSIDEKHVKGLRQQLKDANFRRAIENQLQQTSQRTQDDAKNLVRVLGLALGVEFH